MNSKIKKELIYGIEVYTLTTQNKIPYQLTFERDLFLDRVNVNLLPLISPENNICPDLRNLVCESFVEYFNSNSEEVAYFEIDISYKKGELKLIKFLKWIENFKEDYQIILELTSTSTIKYIEIYISKK